MTNEQIKEFTLRTSSANHTGLMLILFDMEKIYVEDALLAYSNNEIDDYLRNMDLAKKTHNELMSGIEPTDELGKRYLSILRFIYSKQINSCVKRVPDELDRCQRMMDNLREGFRHLNELDNEEPVMKNTHKVYAGLTYGKGTLNESVQGTDYSSRGFKA